MGRREGMLSRVLKIRFYTQYPVCNYSCDYCIASSAKRKESSRWWQDRGRLRYLELINALEAVPCQIDVRIGVGGEFFLDKDLVDGARQLSRSGNCAAVNLITNLSFPFDHYLSSFRDFDLGKVGLVASYHDTQIRDRRQWFDTAERMNRLVDFAVVVVAWPPLLKSLIEMTERFRDAGIPVFIQAFQGRYEDRDYPDSYSEEERDLLRALFYSRHDYDFMVELKKPGLCYAGVDYVYLDMEGVFSRCGMTKMRLGSLLSGRYRLLAEAKPCPMEHCMCDTENLNTKDFRDQYQKTGVNQHKYILKPAVE